MKTKIFTLCATLILGASTLFASDTAVDGIYYDFDDANLTATVTYCGNYYDSYTNEYMGDVVIPESVVYNGETYSVTNIGAYAFFECSGLTSVTIPSSVTSIGSDAFDGCSSLTKTNYTGDIAGWCGIDFSNYKANPTAFSHNLYLNDVEVKNLVIPDGVVSIGACAFDNCSNITSVTIPNSVTSIGYSAFYGCSGLLSINIPNSVENIGSRAFDGVPNIVYSGIATGSPWGAQNVNGYVEGNLLYESEAKTQLLLCSPAATGAITIPNSVTSIEDYAFRNCSGVTSVTIGNSVRSIGTQAFWNCSGLTSITIPNSVISIGNDAFGVCEGLTSVTIGNSVESIGYYAFGDCANLTSIIIPNSVITLGHSVFYRCSGLTSVVIGSSVDSIGPSAFYGCSSLPIVGNLRYADTYLIEAVDKMQSAYTIKEGTKWIGGSAFEGCSGLTSITIPSSLTSIGNLAFKNCTDLTSVTIGNSVTSIGNWAFQGCSSLTSITIPSSVTSIGDWAFQGCSSLTSVVWNAPKHEDFNLSYSYSYNEYDHTELYLPNSNAPFFDLRTQITSFTFGDAVEHIPAYLCYGMENLTSVIIPNSVTSIGDSVFYDCSGLTSVTWNAQNCEDLKKIESYPYYNNTPFFNIRSQITSFTFGDAVEHIPACLCSDMDNLTSITIPNSVTSIGDDAFHGCSGLTSVTIPNSVTSIGDDAFGGCRGLTSVTIGNSVESIGSSAFLSCDGLTEIILPNSLKSLGDWAFGGCTALKSLVIPPSVEVLYMGIVANCNNLTKIIVQNPNIQVYDYGYSREAILSWISHDINTLSHYYISGLPKLDTIVAPAACFDVPEVGLPICTNTLKYAKVTNGNLTSDGFAFLRRSVKYLKTLDMRATTNTEIPDQAMSGCYALDSVLLPSSVEYIGYMAFSECIRLREITIPWTVRKIEARAFENCRNIRLATFLLSVLHAPQRSTSSTQGRSELQEIGDWAFYNCHLLQNVELPEGVEIVGNGAFYGCTYLEELSLPSSVQSIGDNCFALASKLEKITVNAVTPPTIEAKTFYNVDRTIPVVVPSGALESYTAADYWSEFINIEEAPVTAIAATPTIAGLYTESGRIVCEGEFRIYDLLGCDVTRLNGSLCGVYVVKSGNTTQKVVVK